MSEENGTTTSEIKTPVGSLSFSGKRVAEFIAILSLSLMCVLAYALWDHKTEAKEGSAALVGALKELASANQAQVKEQRVMNCLLSTRQDERRTMLAECERIAR